MLRPSHVPAINEYQITQICNRLEGKLYAEWLFFKGGNDKLAIKVTLRLISYLIASFLDDKSNNDRSHDALF